MRICLAWQGLDGRYGAWRDGLWAALKLIEKEHTVAYFDPMQPTFTEKVHEFRPDAVLHWEAPCSANGKDAPYYNAVRKLPYKKALLFAGGPIKKEWCEGYDLFFVESKINEEEFGALGLPWKRAFGVNTQIFKPEKQPKVFDAIHQGTCASWKRQSLFARAMKSKGILCGRFQENDPIGFLTAREQGTTVLPEVSAQTVNALLNASHMVVNTSEFWGGGQRCSLEGLAAGIPVIVMSDSPKNREYIEESGAGLVVDPDENKIREAVEVVKAWSDEDKRKGVAYIANKYTEHHYASAIMEGLNAIV